MSTWSFQIVFRPMALVFTISYSPVKILLLCLTCAPILPSLCLQATPGIRGASWYEAVPLLPYAILIVFFHLLDSQVTAILLLAKFLFYLETQWFLGVSKKEPLQHWTEVFFPSPGVVHLSYVSFQSTNSEAFGAWWEDILAAIEFILYSWILQVVPTESPCIFYCLTIP